MPTPKDWKLLTMKQFKELGADASLADDTLVVGGCTGTIKEVNAAARTVEFVISDESVDRDADTIAVDGWELDTYRTNPVVLFGHKSRELPVAKALEVGPATIDSQKVLRALDEFPTADIYAFADTVYRMLGAGFLNATSVGFRPLKWMVNEERRGNWGPGWDILSAELFEHSVVPVPSNVNALAVRDWAAEEGLDLAPLRDWAMKFLDGEPGLALWVPRDDVEQLHKGLAPTAVATPDAKVTAGGNTIVMPPGSKLVQVGDLTLIEPVKEVAVPEVAVDLADGPDAMAMVLLDSKEAADGGDDLSSQDGVDGATTGDPVVAKSAIVELMADWVKLLSDEQWAALVAKREGGPDAQVVDNGVDVKETIGEMAAQQITLALPPDLATLVKTGEISLAVTVGAAVADGEDLTHAGPDTDVVLELDEPETLTALVEGIDMPEAELRELLAAAVKARFEHQQMLASGRLPQEV